MACFITGYGNVPSEITEIIRSSAFQNFSTCLRQVNPKPIMQNSKSISLWLTSLVLLFAFGYLYAHSFTVKAQSFGQGLGYAITGLLCLGLSICSAFMAWMEHASLKIEARADESTGT